MSKNRKNAKIIFAFTHPVIGLLHPQGDEITRDAQTAELTSSPAPRVKLTHLSTYLKPQISNPAYFNPKL